MTSPRRYAAVLGCVAGLTLFAFTVPATWTAVVVNAVCADRCRLAAPSGHWWRGGAELAVRSPVTAGWLPVGTLAWRPGWQDGPCIVLRLGDGEATLRWTGSQAAATLSTVRLPAEVLLAQPALRWPRTRWGGTLDIETLHARWTPQHHDAEAALRWRHASTAALDDLPLGDYRARVRLRDGSLTIDLAGEPGNALGARLELAASAPNALAVQGTVTATGEAAARLAPVLRTFAQPDGAAGRYRVDIR